MARARIKGPKIGGFQLSGGIGGTRIEVGPNTALQFPYVVLDRALIYCAHAINWAHGRRGQKKGHAPEVRSMGFVAVLSEEHRARAGRYFQALRQGREPHPQSVRQDMKDMLTEVQFLISTGELSQGASTGKQN